MKAWIVKTPKGLSLPSISKTKAMSIADYKHHYGIWDARCMAAVKIEIIEVKETRK